MQTLPDPKIPYIYNLSMNLWYLKCKKPFFENSYILCICYYGMSKNIQKWIFLNFRPKYPKMHFEIPRIFYSEFEAGMICYF